MTSHDAQLRERADDLERGLAAAGDRVDAAVADQVRGAIVSVRERLALGVDHIVVALAGGTGSGKSSLFNRIAGMDFADVGVRRPTTARVTACAWSRAAGPLLDWLEVDPERRITRADELDGDEDAALAGLVLLDLPDHDSIEAAHRAVVDRMIPQVDLLVWVVDPQKYADDALHSQYLRASVGMEGSMAVAVNQGDTVPEGRRDYLVADMNRLLAEDGLRGVTATMVSARTGAGMPALRALLEGAVSRRSIAAGRVAAELDRAARLLLAEVPTDVRPADGAVAVEVAAIAEAAGLEAVAGQLAVAVRNGYGSPEFARVQPDAVATSRTRWILGVSGPLRPGWQRALEAAVSPSARVVTEVRRALAAVPLDPSGPASAGRLRAAGYALLGLGVVALGATIFAATGVLTSGLLAPTGVLTVLALVAALMVGAIARRSRMKLARQRQDEVVAAGRDVIERVIRNTMAEPTLALLEAHAEVRRLARRAFDSDPAAPLAAGAAETGSAEAESTGNPPADDPAQDDPAQDDLAQDDLAQDSHPEDATADVEVRMAAARAAAADGSIAESSADRPSTPATGESLSTAASPASDAEAASPSR